MSIDLQAPISVGRSAVEAVQRHAADAVDVARSGDLPAPFDAVAHAGSRARRAARRLERRADHASKRAAARVQQESRRVARATAPDRRRRKVLVMLVVVVGGAALVAVFARRMRQMADAETMPDPSGNAMRASESAREYHASSVTTA
jgi:hypothetical protein